MSDQQLAISAPIDAVALARCITRHAYAAGATLVTTLHADDQTTLARFQAGTDASFDAAVSWLFDGIAAAFKGGAARLAITGEDPGLLGGRRLGEVALVPHSSPISAFGIVFNNTLLDENAASHIAVGQSYTETMKGGNVKSPADLAASGANTSLIYVYWMIGSGEVDVDGMLPDGSIEPLMRKGEWAA